MTHYSDDNPQTFTVKKKKGESPQQQSDDEGESSKVASREKPKIKKTVDTSSTTNRSSSALTTVEAEMDDIIMTSTGRVIKRTSKGADTSIVVGNSKKRRASTGSQHPTSSPFTTKSDVVVTTTDTTTGTDVDYGINPRTGKRDKRFKKKLHSFDADDDKDYELIRTTHPSTATPGTSTGTTTQPLQQKSSSTVGWKRKVNTTVTDRQQSSTSSSKVPPPVSKSIEETESSSHAKDPTQSPPQHDTFSNETVCLTHTAAIQPILPLPILLPPLTMVSSSAAKNLDSVRISTTPALWSDRVVPPTGLISKGPTWKSAITTTTPLTMLPSTTTLTSTTSTQSLGASGLPQPHTQRPPTPITWFSLREDDPSYAVTGDGLGDLSLYDLSAAAPELCPISVIQSTSAAQREQQSEQKKRQQQQQQQQQQQMDCNSNKPVAKRTYVSYPNAIVQCHWCKQLLIVLTADEIEILQLPNRLSHLEEAIFGVQTIAHWPLTILNDPSLQIVTNRNRSQISIASIYMWQRFNNSNRTTQSPCFSVQYNNDATGSNHENDEYTILWTTRSSDTFNPTLLQIKVKPVTTQSDTSSNSDVNATTTMESIVLPSNKDGITAAEAYSSSWRCWTTLCEQPYSQPDQDVSRRTGERSDTTGRSFLMIAQTGLDMIELLRCRSNDDGVSAVKASLDEDSTVVWQDRAVEIILRQSLPVSSSKANHNSNSSNNGSNCGANDSNHPNGMNKNYNFLQIPDCCLQQYSQFTFVTGTGSRGIRMYRTETLEAVATFGENVQVHGKVAVWSRCAWIKAGTLRDANIHVDMSSCNTGPTNSSTTVGATYSNMTVSSENAAAITTILSVVGKKKASWWIEHNDELAIREREKDRLQDATPKETTVDDEYWLIGIPHPFKGPSEIKTNMYLWKPGAFAATEHESTTTLQLPAGGCFGDYFVSSKCQRMVCVGAESSQMYLWSSVLRTDFAGIMYPVGYKVITDNLEYIEDEDEIDVVMEYDSDEKHAPDSDDHNDTNEATHLDCPVDCDLAEAMRLSLLELQRQQSNAVREEKISVLCDKLFDKKNGIEDFVIPPWPDRSWADGNEPSSPGSPHQRHRALSSSIAMDSSSSFEYSFLNVLPHFATVRDDVKNMIQKRIQRKEAADNGVPILDKLKPKPKKARTANVEALLQSSMDADLRRRMDDIRTIWTSGEKGALPMWNGPVDALPSMLQLNGAAQIAQNDSLTTGVSASLEEKALAMELLHLSPSNVNMFQSSENAMSSERSEKLLRCLACSGRFVLHSCGMREKPIDYDEIARLEQQEKEREEEEKQKERMLKKRQADAKRKESRRKKKEDDEQKKIEESEHVETNYQEATTADGAWAEQRTFHEDYTHPSHQNYEQNVQYGDSDQTYEQNAHYGDSDQLYGKGEVSISSMNENSNINDTNYNRYNETETETLKYSSVRPWGRAEQDFDCGLNKNGSIHINGTEVKPSTSLHPMDALEALAGLAGSMAKPVLIKETVHNFNVDNTATDDDRYDGQSQSNGYGNRSFDETRKVKSPPIEDCGTGISHRFYSESVMSTNAHESEENYVQVAPIAHVDYRDGKGGLAQLESSLPVQTTAHILTPPLHKPVTDPSLDQAMILAEMAETAVVHGTNQFQRSFQNESVDRGNETSNVHSYHSTLEQSPEAEALLALAFSASPKSFERPTIEWTAPNEQQHPMSITTEQTMYNYSPSSQRSCFGSTTSSTHAIVVSQFLQQPMAASLTNAAYSTINNNINSSNTNAASDENNNTSAASADNSSSTA